MALLKETLPPGPPGYPRRFDLLIVDEVHGGGTDRGRALCYRLPAHAGAPHARPALRAPAVPLRDAPERPLGERRVWGRPPSTDDGHATFRWWSSRTIPDVVHAGGAGADERDRGAASSRPGRAGDLPRLGLAALVPAHDFDRDLGQPDGALAPGPVSIPSRYRDRLCRTPLTSSREARSPSRPLPASHR